MEWEFVYGDFRVGEAMKVDLSYQAESSDELVFIERVAQARIEAIEAGVSEDTVDRVLQVFLLDGGGVEGGNEKSSVRSSCPSCGVEIVGAEATSIGSNPVVLPCECEVGFEELPDEVLDDLLSG